METSTRRMLGEILMEQGLLSRAQLRVALVHHHELHVPMGRAIIREGFCSEDAVLRALSVQAGVETVDLAQEPPNRKLVRLVPRKVALRYRIVPLRLEKRERDVLHIALPAPASIEALDAVRATSNKRRVEARIASDMALHRALSELYRFKETPEPPLPDLPPPRPDSPILLYGWPSVTVVLISRLLARNGLAARSVSPLQTLHTRPSDIVFAPVIAMEGLLAGEAEIRGQLIVQGPVTSQGFAQAQRVGAQGFVPHALDEVLLVRAIRRLRPSGASSQRMSEGHEGGAPQ
jgi:hypothetical protein